METYDYKKEAKVFADNCISDLLDMWQCIDWNCTAEEFFTAIANEVNNVCAELVLEFQDDDDEE